MTRILAFEINCGEKTCASEPGRFCEFFCDNCFGRPSCFFFGKLRDDEDGWVRRHERCLALEGHAQKQGESPSQKST